jgi:DNA segregation ATPase FtsK/SpoIIIE-like protein
VAYALTADEIFFLTDLGLSLEMIKAVADHQPGVAVEPPPPAPEIASADDEPPPAVSLPPAEDSVQETVVDAPVDTAPPSDDVDVSSFYGALSPYGSWLNVDGTWCWQPTAMVVDSGWSPYCQRGHWVYTDCGWMWQSDYSWGWAPFHYGRWSRHSRYGWIWLPDTEWGPAWVSWRHSDAAIGWAPLPPGARYEAGIGFSFHGNRVGADFAFGLESRHFTFVPVAHFSERVLVRSRLPRTEVTRIYNTTTIIQNNYTHINNRIINRGPSITRIKEVTHQEIRQLKIVDQKNHPGQPIRRGAISGESIEIYRPNVASRPHETPKAVVARQEASMRIKHEEVRKVSVLDTYKSGPVVQAAGERGKASLGAGHSDTTPHIPSRPPVPPVINQRQINDAATRQRQAEEETARVREEQQRRTDAITHQQEQKRNAEVLASQQEEQRRHGEELARQQEEQRRQAANLTRQQEQKRNAEEIARQREEQRRRTEELSRQQAEQKQRVAELTRQQEQQRRAEELSRQQADQQQRAQEQARQQEMQRQRAQEQARQQEGQRRAWQAQRQAEEAAARQHQQQEQQQAAQQRAQQSAFQGSGNSSMTSQASNRGDASRGGAKNRRNR